MLSWVFCLHFCRPAQCYHNSWHSWAQVLEFSLVACHKSPLFMDYWNRLSISVLIPKESNWIFFPLHNCRSVVGLQLLRRIHNRFWSRIPWQLSHFCYLTHPFSMQQSGKHLYLNPSITIWNCTALIKLLILLGYHFLICEMWIMISPLGSMWEFKIIGCNWGKSLPPS